MTSLPERVKNVIYNFWGNEINGNAASTSISLNQVSKEFTWSLKCLVLLTIGCPKIWRIVGAGNVALERCSEKRMIWIDDDGFMH